MIGRIFSQYRITERIGAGAMGSVYKAEHTRVSHTVAIKFISDHLLSDPVAKERFVREAHAVAAIDHPNVCRFYAIDETPEGRLYIIISYCDGETLAARLARGPLPVADAVEIAASVADGLHAAHREGIVHRDIKPANLIFGADGQVKIVDFGLARLTERTQVSATDTTVGTVVYMSPEQASSSRVDGRSDIFSLGSVLYEMLTGVPPFAADHPHAVMYRIKAENYRPVREIRPDVPAALERIVERALAKPVDQRYRSASEMAGDLFSVLAEVAPERLYRHRPKPHRRLLRRALPIVAAALLIAVAVWKYDDLRHWANARHPALTIAVLARGTETDTEHLFIRGLAHDITDRIRRFGRPNVWAVPPSRIRSSKAQTADEAARLIGANCVLELRGDPMLGASKIDVERLDVASPVVSTGIVSLTGSRGGLDPAQVVHALGELVDLKMETQTMAGYTANPAAYRAYLIGLGDLDGAKPDLDATERTVLTAVSTDSTFSRAWALLGETYRRRFAATKDSAWAEKAAGACRTALRQYPDQAEAWVTLGRLSLLRDRVPAAESAFQSALAIDRRNPDALRELASAYEAANRLSDAEAMYIRATTENPADVGAHELLGYFYYVHGRHLEAIPAFQRNAGLAKDYAQTYNYLGACYFALDCWEKAILAFEQSFNLRRSYVACSNLGTLYYLHQRFDDAARMYEWATEYRKNHEMVGFLGAACFWIKDQRERSLALYADAIALAEEQRRESPRDAQLLSELSGYYAVTRSDSAEVLADRALILSPDDGMIHYRCALTYETIGEREKALVHLGRAMNDGCSLRQIGSEQFLAELRKDPRYELLVAGAGKKEVKCDDLR